MAGIATYHVVTLAVQYVTHTHDVAVVNGYVTILLLHLLHDLCSCKAQGLLALLRTMKNLTEYLVNTVKLLEIIV